MGQSGNTPQQIPGAIEDDKHLTELTPQQVHVPSGGQGCIEGDADEIYLIHEQHPPLSVGRRHIQMHTIVGISVGNQSA